MLPFAKAKKRAQHDANVRRMVMIMYRAGNGHWMHMPFGVVASSILQNPLQRTWDHRLRIYPK